MKYAYTAVYQIRGLTQNADEKIEIYSKEGSDSSVKAILTSATDEVCKEIDRALALGYLMLKGFVGQREIDAVSYEIEKIQESRKIDLEGAVALIFTATGNVDVNINSPLRETEDYVVGIDLFSKDDIVSDHRNQINSIIASLCLASIRTPIHVKKLRSDVYLINDSTKPVYSISIAFSGEGYSSTQITSQLIDNTHAQLKKRSSKTLSKVYRLLTQAISRDNDELRRFMFGWAGLEVLVKSVFSEYEKLFVQSLLGSDPASPTHRYIKRVREAMKGKYNIADQFVIMAACLGEGPVEADIEEFIRIKKIRDSLFHDTSIAEKGLPGFEIIELLKKYLRLHTSNEETCMIRENTYANE